MRYNVNNHNPDEIKKIIRNLYYTSRFNKSQWIERVCPPPVGYAQFAFIIFPKGGYKDKDGKECDGYVDYYRSIIQNDHIIGESDGFVKLGYNYLISKLKSEKDEFEILGLDNSEYYKEWSEKDINKAQNEVRELRIKFFEEMNKSYDKR